MKDSIDRSQIAKFYGLSETEFRRYKGSPLETSIQALRDALSDSIMAKIIEREDLWNEKAKLLMQSFVVRDPVAVIENLDDNSSEEPV